MSPEVVHLQFESAVDDSAKVVEPMIHEINSDIMPLPKEVSLFILVKKLV